MPNGHQRGDICDRGRHRRCTDAQSYAIGRRAIQPPDFTLFLGDYIYEYADPKPGIVRRNSGGIEAPPPPTPSSCHRLALISDASPLAGSQA
jgi:hypothetical protein